MADTQARDANTAPPTVVAPVAVLGGRLLALRADLARVHDWLATMWPADLPAPVVGAVHPDGGAMASLNVYCWEDGDFTRAVRLLAAAAGKVDKQPTDSFMNVVGRIGAVEIHVIADRHQVCQRRQVGTTTELRPAPDAPMVEVEVPVFVWDCEPILPEAG